MEEKEDSASNDVSTLEGGGWVEGNGITSGGDRPCAEELCGSVSFGGGGGESLVFCCSALSSAPTRSLHLLPSLLLLLFSFLIVLLLFRV